MALSSELYESESLLEEELAAFADHDQSRGDGGSGHFVKTVEELNADRVDLSGVLDLEEAKLLKYTHMARYAMVFLQIVMFTVMFCHTMEIWMFLDNPDYTCPRNLLMTSAILSSIILVAGMVAIMLAAFLKFC